MQQVSNQLARQPAGSMSLLGPSLAFANNQNPSSQFNVAWIGPDNLVYQAQLGSQTPPAPTFDCNQFNQDGTVARAN